ncbi:MAG: GIY-YIG nuclease family protein [Pseudomonadota bacterium]
MGDDVGEIHVLALDCQASGSTPAYGDLLELGWATCSGAGLVGPVRSRWILPRTARPIPRAVRELTGWSEACLDGAVDEREAWAELRADMAGWGGGSSSSVDAPPSPADVPLPAADAPAPPAGVPTVIHFARFEVTFLRDLCQRVEGSAAHLPLDVICLHTIAARLFPDLPRRNIRALAGHLGHSPELVRRTAGHVEATAFIWRALLPLLEEVGVRTWADLRAWIAQPAAPRARRARLVYPLAAERRTSLPDRPGVYRFLRRSGDVLYVGKATSLRKRVASHFRGRGPVNERVLELLTQVHDVVPTETASLLEAALLETDEIKRLNPPYNVQLRSVDRHAWFAAADLLDAVQSPDATHRIGPLPSRRALAPLGALTLIVGGAAVTPELRAAALAVPTVFGPPAALFDEGFRAFAAEHLGDLQTTTATAAERLAHASRALWLLRGRAEPDAPADDAAAGPADWDLARVRRRLERNLVQTGLLMRRARFLCLLSDATVSFRERDMPGARALTIAAGDIRDRRDLQDVTTIFRETGAPALFPRPHHERQACFDAAVYDRLRVLLTELHRVRQENGEVALRIGAHTFPSDRLARLMRTI